MSEQKKSIIFLISLIFLISFFIIKVYHFLNLHNRKISQPSNISPLYTENKDSLSIKSTTFTTSSKLYELRHNAIVKAIEKIGPAVVNINAYIYEENYPENINQDFFQYFFDLEKLYPSYKNQINLGSGVIINEKGYILTNEHLIKNANKIEVILIDGRKFKAKIIGKSSEVDIALIKIEKEENFPVAYLGNSNDLLIGEWVVAIGNPVGLEHTVTAGIISALHRSLSSPDDKKRLYEEMIQIDASINPGNSGGPLVNVLGEVIGINTAIYRDVQGIGFAIPINIAKKIVNDLIQYGKVIKLYLGILPQEITEELGILLKIKDKKGLLIADIVKNSPAEKANLKRGDVIISMGDKKINNLRSYRRALLEMSIGKAEEVIILRNGVEKKIIIVPIKPPATIKGRIGIEVDNISSILEKKYNLLSKKGVIITKVFSGSNAERVLKEGDIIRQINNTLINNEEDYKQAFLNIEIGETILLFVIRGRVGFYITLIAEEIIY